MAYSALVTRTHTRPVEGLDNLVVGTCSGYQVLVGKDGLIMGAQDASGLKEVKKQYGPQMVYAYGCAPGTCEFWVYRITMTNEDGEVEELSFPRVQQRAVELGIKCVPLLAVLCGYEAQHEQLQTTVDHFVNGYSGEEALPSTLDLSHIREGVVVRYESEHGTGWLKSKSFTFGRLEGYLKDRDDFVDMEEVG